MDDVPPPPRDLAGPEPADARPAPAVPQDVEDQLSKSAALSVLAIGAGILLCVPMAIVAFVAALVAPFGPVIWFLLPVGLTALSISALRRALRANAAAAAIGGKRHPGTIVLACVALVVTLALWLVPVGIGQYLAASFP